MRCTSPNSIILSFRKCTKNCWRLFGNGVWQADNETALLDCHPLQEERLSRLIDSLRRETALLLVIGYIKIPLQQCRGGKY